MKPSRKHAPVLPLSRRDFLKISGIAGGGLMLAISLGGCDEQLPMETPTAMVSPTSTATASASALPTSIPNPTGTLEQTATPRPLTWFKPNVFVQIGTDNVVTITVHKSEMGQGVRTALPMIIAEELEVDWENIRVEQAPAGAKYGNQSTGGSTSIFENYNPLRRAGAIAREMLIAAAAQIWEVEKETCYAERGTVVHQPTGRVLSYGDLVEAAAALDVPTGRDAPLKAPEDFRLIGTQVGRVDAPQIVTGQAVYGIDVKIPGMLYAAIARPPVLGGELVSFNATNAMTIAGVQQVVRIESGVAVIADNTWAAFRGRDALEINWEDGPNTELSTASIRETLVERALERSTAEEGENILKSFYEVPYFAHATMEPMNCVADVGKDYCEIWAPTQVPQEAAQIAQRLTGLSESAVTVHVTLMGGGFGRRREVDYVSEAVQVSQAAGIPIKAVWTREDDIRYDYFHPFTYHLAYTRLDQPALPQVQTFRSSSYAPVPTGSWRAVTNIPDAYVRECFLDEMAVALNRDPYELRMELEPEILWDVLEAAATKSGWGSDLPEGWGRGIAAHATWNSCPVAIVVELSVGNGGQVEVHRVVCAIDCGIVINPDMVEAQMEGGIVFGLTAALKGEGITLENGQVQQSNFHDVPLWHFDEMPEIEVHVLSSERAPRGVGEMSTPPLIPAVVNAIYAATGKRIRKIPIRPEDIQAG